MALHPGKWTIAFVAVGAIFASRATSLAQGIGIGGGEVDRSFRPGAYVPYDGVGRMHRINYDLGAPAFYFGYDACRLSYLDYLDRLDRQQHFGHTWHSRKYGPVYQIMRIENEYWGKWAPLCTDCWPW